MVTMESYTLELYPNRGPIYFGLFQNVENAQELKDKFQHDQYLGATLIDAKMVLNKFHLLLAVNRAIHDEQTTKIKTQTIYSEILFGFGTNNNIAKTFKNFGIKEDSKKIIVVVVGSETPEDALRHIQEFVEGDLIDFERLKNIRDWKAIEKIYQLDDQQKNEERIMPLIATSMGLKGHH